jgi:hypothetical protein
MVGAVITSFLIYPIAERWWERPNIAVEGALAIYLYESATTTPLLPSPSHDALGLILKVKNLSKTPADVHGVMLEGCVQTDVATAELTLPPEEHLSDDGSTSIYDVYSSAVQRLRLFGAVDSGFTVPAYGVEYISVIFPLAQRGVHFLADKSVSATGNCEQIVGAIEYASVDQIFTMESHEVRSLRPEVASGRLRFSLFAGDTHVFINPHDIVGLLSFPPHLWRDLALQQIYEGRPKEFLQVGTKIYNIR